MSVFEGKRIVLGVTGSIAAYRAADLTSQLTQAGAQVQVVMTEAATRIVGAVTLRTLSRREVMVDMWETAGAWQPGHIEIADTADLLAVVPATANTIAQFAHGLAPDLLSNIYLATRAPVLIAPAMNGKMLEHPATQANLRTLTERGHRIVTPVEGLLACGYVGNGKLAVVTEIMEAMAQTLAGQGDA